MICRSDTLLSMVLRDFLCKLKKLGVAFACFGFFAAKVNAADPSVAATAETHSLSLSNQPAAGMWETGVGQGFRSSAQDLTFGAGATQGLAVLGGIHSHDLALLSLSYGHMLGHTVGLDRFYRGNWEFRAELFGGSEFAPTSNWVIGLTPHLRYNFATGICLVPYLDAGAGVTATSISAPDLSNTFEFNLQATIGAHWFFRENAALTLEARYLHMSCAGISSPNLGLNAVVGLIGLSFFF